MHTPGKNVYMQIFMFVAGSVIEIVACALSGYIFVNPFTCVTDRYQPHLYIIMETETETNINIFLYRDFIS